MRQTHRDVTGDAPPESERPSSDQLAALKTRLEAGESPYVDFALWTPFGKRGAKLRKFDSQVFVDNELRNRPLTGPSNFDAWLASWKVFRSAMIMQGAASPAILDKYANGIRDLANIHPGSWGIIFVAGELNRFERWENIFEELQDGDDEFRKQAGFKADLPWNTVIKLSTFGVNFQDYSHWWFLHVLSVATGKVCLPQAAVASVVLDVSSLRSPPTRPRPPTRIVGSATLGTLEAAHVGSAPTASRTFAEIAKALTGAQSAPTPRPRARTAPREAKEKAARASARGSPPSDGERSLWRAGAAPLSSAPPRAAL